jgi:hypothetical protein
MRSASLTSCAVVHMACGVLSHVQWTSMSLARPLRPRLISSCNPLNTAVKRRKRRTVLAAQKPRLSVFFVHAHRDCVLLAAGSSLRLQTNKWYQSEDPRRRRRCMHHGDRHARAHALLRVATARRLHHHRQEGVVHQRGASSLSGSSRKRRQVFRTRC